jgi:hypothetical protein
MNENIRNNGQADDTHLPPFETRELRHNLVKFLDTKVADTMTGIQVCVGNYKFGVYAFFDYDGEPIYVGQTNERLRTRIRRHLTNQRTDAVAMNVLDPFEVYKITVWPLSRMEGRNSGDEEAKEMLNALEYQIFEQLLIDSHFNAVLNEKDPPSQATRIEIPEAYSAVIVSDEVYSLRKHPDVRIARRALVLSRLAQVISERLVQNGLRKTLLTQAKRLSWLAQRRFDGLGGTLGEEGDENSD